MIKIIIADDHSIVRQGLIQILSKTTDMVVSAEATNGAELMDKLREENVDLIILDVSMPGRSGLDILADLKWGYPDIPVLILSIHPEEQYAVRFLKSGAAGYLTKETAPKELVKAIRKVHSGGRYVGAHLAELLAWEIGEEPGRLKHESLSDREFQIMILIASGNRLVDIAEQLALSVKTIGTYRTRILKKMKLGNNADLTAYCIQHQLLSKV